MSIQRRRRRSENFYSGLSAVAATTDTGYEVYSDTGSRLFLPGGTNYCKNPSFEVESATPGKAANWDLAAMSSVTGTTVWSLVPGRLGGLAQRVQYTGVAGDAAGKTLGILFDTGGLTAGDVLTTSAYAKGSFAGCTPYHNEYSLPNYDGGSFAVPWTIGTEWSRSSWVKTVYTGNNGVSLRLFVKDIHEGDTIDITIDDVLIEKSSVLTPYFDGSTSDSLNASTYAWTGTANASTSTRAASVLSIPSPWATVPAAGTIAGRGTPLGANTAYTTEVLTGLYDTDTLRAGLNHKGGKRNMYVTAESTSAATFTTGTVGCSVGRWDAAGTYLHFNGTAATDGAAPTTGGALTHVKIGVSGAYYLGPKLYLARCLTAAQAVALDAIFRGTINEAELMTLKREWMRSGDALFTGRRQDGSQLFVKG